MDRKSEVPEASFVDCLPDLPNKDLEQDESVSCSHTFSDPCEIHKFLAPEEITSELGMRRLQENKKDLHKKKNNDKIYCYRTKRGEWIPELRNPNKDFFGMLNSDLKTAVYNAMKDPLNFKGRYFRKGDTPKVATYFDGAAARGHRVKFWPRPVMVVHEDGDPVGRMQFDNDEISPTARPRIFHPIDRHYNIPELDPEKLDIEPLPFESTTTDVVTVAGFNLKDQQWMFQPRPYDNVELPPWKTPFHYGDGFITGMVFYKDEDGSIYGFRPDLHIARAVSDAEKLGFPKMTPEMLEAMLRTQLLGDRRWIPSVGNPAGNRYYLRFTGFPNVDGPRLAGPNRKILLVGTPIGDYKGTDSMRVALRGRRPVVPGLGSIKASVNYAHAVRDVQRAGAETQSRFDEALFCDGDFLQEGTSSNVGLVVYGAGEGGRDLVLTPMPKAMDILPGVTMRSALELARAHGMDAREDFICREPMLQMLRDGIAELFMTGTAMTLCEVRELVDQEGRVVYRRNSDGLSRVSALLRSDLHQILKRQHPNQELNKWMQKVV